MGNPCLAAIARLGITLLVAVSMTSMPSPALAAMSSGKSHSSSHSSGTKSLSSTGVAHGASGSSSKAAGVKRNATGHIRRDPAARRAFQHAHPCPSTGKTSGACPGYVVDHVKPLKRGGADSPSNMQWQTVPEAKRKDKIE